MNIKSQVKEMDDMVSQGRIIDAVDKFFHTDIITKEVKGDVVKGKAEKRKMLEGFLSNIQSVNGIKVVRSAVEDNISMSEFIINLGMKDGSTVYWDEVIRREWKDGKVVDEKYFQN